VRNAAPAALASAENGAAARAAYEALRSGDLPGVGSYFAGDVVWEALDMLPTGGVIHGRDAVLEQ
jgi:ketosteroid isomerase-like protein